MKPLNPVDNYLFGSWEALGNGAPMLVALAQLCSEVWAKPSGIQDSPLTGEAKAILFSARDRGTIEIKAVNSAFDPAARMLAVYVEENEERTIAFRDPTCPEITVRFLDGFRQLCQLGLVMHHIYRDFSLTASGFELARNICREEVQLWLDKATEFGIHD